MVNIRARLSRKPHLLDLVMTLVRSVMMEAKSTKKVNGSPTRRSAAADAPDRFPADLGMPTTVAKTDRKYLRMILWACLSAGFLGAGSLACGVLSQEENSTTAMLLFLAALAGAGGCLFCFYRFLREISRKPRLPFISTLH
jgi:hypothetical protein